MPLSTIATRTPAPVAPPQAHSGDSSPRSIPVTATSSWASTAHTIPESSLTAHQHGDQLRHPRVPHWVRAGQALQQRAQLRGRREEGRASRAEPERHPRDVGEDGHQFEVVEGEASPVFVDQLDGREHDVVVLARDAQHASRPAVEAGGDPLVQPRVVGRRFDGERLSGPDDVAAEALVFADRDTEESPSARSLGGDDDELVGTVVERGDPAIGGPGGLDRGPQDGVEHGIGGNHARRLVAHDTARRVPLPAMTVASAEGVSVSIDVLTAASRRVPAGAPMAAATPNASPGPSTAISSPSGPSTTPRPLTTKERPPAFSSICWPAASSNAVKRDAVASMSSSPRCAKRGIRRSAARTSTDVSATGAPVCSAHMAAYTTPAASSSSWVPLSTIRPRATT